jgi:formylglycine-generating enzyme required for sulfatase activity
MQPHARAHPSDELLLALGSGRLDDATAARVLAHLETCPACRARAAGLPDDSLLVRLRAAQARSDTSPPARPGQAGLPSAPAAAQGVPPELLQHEQYEVVRELGRGGMGVVYLARNKLMARPEVLKVVSRRLLDQPGAAERFLREIRSAANLSHPNIVTAYSALRVGELLVLAMEYVDGEDLARVVKARGPLPMVNACAYAHQVARGLQHACDKGLVHRDIKPQNLILARDGKKHVVKILDFGLAKATREQGGAGPGLTGSGAALGTPEYMAPEQALDAARADIRADVYSLGCTLYYLLAGAPPFQASSLYELLHAHQAREAAPLAGARGDVPPGLAAVVARMMAKDPGRRYQQPAEVAQALAPFARGSLRALPAGAPPAAAGPPAVSVAGEQDTAAAVPVLYATQVEGRATVARAGRKAGAGRARPSGAKGSRRWLLLAGAALLLLAGAVGLWAGGVFRLRTPEGILVVEVNEKNPDVYVDGERMAVTWGEGGRTAVIRLRPGTHKVEVKKGGFTAFGEEVELREGDHRILTARLVSQAPPPGKVPAGEPPKGRPQGKDGKPPASAAGTGRSEKGTAVAKGPVPPRTRPDEPPKSRPEKKEGTPRPAPSEGMAKAKQRPPPAKAPFSEATAKELQRAWATYLGKPVEEEVDLGGGATMRFVLIPPGTFTMGSPKEEKGRCNDEEADEVTITKPFYLGKYPVTQEQYERLTGKNPSYFAATGDGKAKVEGLDTKPFPVEQVSWEDATAFCRKLAERTGHKARLPSEAEWEYACRAGTTTPFHFGKALNGTQANCNGNYPYGRTEKGPYLAKTCPVKSYDPNAFGLYGMHGNVWQWCQDWYAESCADLKGMDPLRVDKGSSSGRVLRGGSWFNYARHCRAASRDWHAPAYRNDDVGFRVALLPPDGPTKMSGRKKDPEPSPGPGAGKAGTGQRPPLARAPFDSQRAKELQRAWAKHLGRKAEEEVDLGGGVTMQFILIPPGTFTMGSPKGEEGSFHDEGAHEVTITRPFYLGRYTVTQEQYQQLTGKNPSWFSSARGRKTKVEGLDTGRFPVEEVSWEDATAFCAKLAEKSGRKARLPSEAEWEYACRAGTTTPFHFGTALNGTQANCDGTYPYGTQKKGPYLGRTCQVKSYPANAFGLCDMHGNVWQWCQDWYADSCADLPGADPIRADKGSHDARVQRGGSWIHNARFCRAACRSADAPTSRADHRGFRVAFRLD